MPYTVENRMTGGIEDLLEQEFLFAGNSFWCFRSLKSFVEELSDGTIKEGFIPVLIALEQSFVVSISKVGCYMKDKYGNDFCEIAEKHQTTMQRIKMLRDKYLAHMDKKYLSHDSVWKLFSENPYDFDDIENMFKDMARLIYKEKNDIFTFITKDSFSFDKILKLLKTNLEEARKKSEEWENNGL